VALVRGDDDVAHALHPTDGLATSLWTRRTGRPSVLTFPRLATRRQLVRRRRRVEILRHAAAGVSAVTVHSRAAADALWRWAGIDARVIYPGLDLRAFVQDGRRTDSPTIGCNLDETGGEGLQLLVDALAHLREAPPLVLASTCSPIAGAPTGPGVVRAVHLPAGLEGIRAVFQRVQAEGGAHLGVGKRQRAQVLDSIHPRPLAEVGAGELLPFEQGRRSLGCPS